MILFCHTSRFSLHRSPSLTSADLYIKDLYRERNVTATKSTTQKVGLKNVERHSGIVLRTVLFVCCFFVDAAPTAFQKTQRRIGNRWLLPFYCKAMLSASIFSRFPGCYAPDRQRTGNDLKSPHWPHSFKLFLQEVSARACF